MRRYPAYDPPEYVSWRPDPGLLEDYFATIEADPVRRGRIDRLEPRRLLELYRDLLRTRLLDVQLKRWVRQGVISKAWLGTGEEAVTVGAVHALDPRRDWVCPMIRNAGACHMMGMSLADLLRGYLATPDGPNGGRDLHVGDLRRHVLQPISHMGTNVPVMAGVALALRARGEGGVALTFIGDGATKTAECHEGLELAAALELPVVYVLQDNRVALGTPAGSHGAGRLDRWGAIYGLTTDVADGNHVLDMRAATRLAVERCRRGRGPALLLARTFRMGGHATHDEREARATFPEELFREWGRRDPIGLYEAFLLEKGSPRELLERIEERVLAEVDTAAEEALASREAPHDPQAALMAGVSEGPPTVGLGLRPL